MTGICIGVGLSALLTAVIYIAKWLLGNDDDDDLPGFGV